MGHALARGTEFLVKVIKIFYNCLSGGFTTLYMY